MGLKLLACLILGVISGMAFFCALEWNVQLYSKKSGIRLALFIHATRFLGLAMAFVGFAKLGAAPLLSALAGFQLARVFVVGAKDSTLEAL